MVTAPLALPVAQDVDPAGEHPLDERADQGLAEWAEQTETAPRSAIAVRPKPARRLPDHYLLGDVLGRGSLGTTYRAHDEAAKRPAVIKWVAERFGGDPRFAERLMGATAAAACLDHPHIVKILDSGIADGRPFVVMEQVEGRSLRAVLDDPGKLPIEQCVRIAVQIADALAYAHRRYVAHGDLRPENVLLDARGNVKLTDFGLVRAAVTTDRTLLGTALRRAAYIPPEQLGQAVPDDRTDVYGLGALLYELLTGTPATSGKTVLLGSQHPERPLPPRRLRPELPWRVDRAVMSALSPDSRDGFLSVQEFRTALIGSPTSMASPQPAGWWKRTGAAVRRPLHGRPAARPGYIAASLAIFLAVAFAAAALFALLSRGPRAADAPSPAGRGVLESIVATPDDRLRPGSEVRRAMSSGVLPQPADAESAQTELAQP